MEIKTAVVTGGCGFIGSHLVDRLVNEGIKCTIVDNLSNGRMENIEKHLAEKNVEVAVRDISEYDSFEEYFRGADAVFHLAALADIVPSIENPDAYHRANVDGTFNVLKACVKNNVKRLVYAASSSCYGIPDSYPTSEDAEIRPQYPYALTKYLGECYVMHFGLVYKLPVVSLRLFNVYGPRARTSGTYGAVFGVFLRQKIAGAPFTVVGDGTQTRDFTFVTDVADAFYIAALSNAQCEIFNIGSGNTYSVNRLAELLEGKKTYIPKRPGEPDCTFADMTKIKNSLGWEPKVSFEEGVAEILENIDYWKNAPLWDPSSIAKATEKWFEYLS